VLAQEYYADADFYLNLTKQIPKVIPCPDEVRPNNKNLEVPELIYKADSDEDVEALRFQIALTFGAAHWWGIFDDESNTFEIRTEVVIGARRFRLRILNVFSAEYCFNPYRREGQQIIGTVKSRRFHPWKQTREEFPTSLFLQRAKESNEAIPSLIQDAQVLTQAALILQQRGLNDAEKSNISSEEGY
jgi:hypothetical protein